MLKKGLMCLLVGFVLFYIVSNHFDVFAKENNNIHEEIKESIYINECNNCKIIDEDVYIINNQSYFKKYNLTIDGVIISYVSVDDYIYMIYKNNSKYCLEKYSVINKSSSYVYYKDKVNNIVIKNDLIYVIGNINNDASILIYDIELNLLSSYYYGGDGFEEYNNIYFKDESIYLIGLKDGISHGSVFLNSGNNNELKSFVVKLNKDYKIEKVLYINEFTKEEHIVNLYFANNKIYLLLQDYEYNYFQYVVDLNLKICEKFNVSSYCLGGFIYHINSYNMEKEKIYLYTFNNKLYYGVFTNKFIYNSLIKIDITRVLFSHIKNGKLVVYYMKNNQVIKLEVSMYIEEENNEKIVQYKDDDYFSTNHFKVRSYFTKLEFEYDEENNILFNKAGVYEAKYKAVVSSDYIVFIKTKYKVLPFVNIVNEGIYNSGYKVEFSDDLYINGNKAYNGEVLNNEGVYQIVHRSNDSIFNYTIYITSNYYKDLNLNSKYASVELAKNDKYIYNIKMNSEKIVKKIIVNNKEFDYLQDKNEIKLVFDDTSRIGVFSYNIQYIEFDDGTIYQINKPIIIKVIKNLPTINVFSENQKIIYDISDEDKTITDVLVRYYVGDEIVNIDKTYLKNFKVKYLSNYSKVDVVMLYEDLRSITYERILFSLKGSSNKDVELFDIKFTQDEFIKEIKFENINTKKLNVDDAKIIELSVTNELKTKKNITFVYIIIFVTIILTLISFFIYITTKKTSKKSR